MYIIERYLTEEMLLLDLEEALTLKRILVIIFCFVVILLEL